MKNYKMSPRSIATVALTLAVFCAAVLVLSNRWAADAAGQQDDRNAIADNAQEAQAQVATVEQFTNEDGTINLFVEMAQEPLTVVYAKSLAGTKRGAAARARATMLVRQQLPQIKESQGRLAQLLTKQFGATEIYRTQRVINGIAVRVAANKFDELRAIAGVKTVHILVPEYPTNETSIPFLRLPDLWGGTTGNANLPAGLTGTGVRIGIIDTGIDYQHANFGGTGALADYQANNRTVITDGTFPTAKVVGGFDFAGDAYTGSNTPTPDPDPMDCNSHGTHVAGTAAGLGVTDDGNPDTMDQGATFAGPYDSTVPFNTLRIGPGAAPGASLFALRVFGCGGSTGLTAQAIEYAVDPNGDGDFGDRLDVINMSLGSNFGTPSNPSVIASNNAALAGVIVVASAGNAGDTYFITGAPGSAERAVSVAASVDSGQLAVVVRVNAPAAIAGSRPAGTASLFGPQTFNVTNDVVIALDGANADGPSTTDGCTPFTNAAAVAGKIALIDRGTCGFTVKTKNAQDAGAIAVIIANNVVGDPFPPGLGGTDATITIPAVSLALEDANALRQRINAGDTVNVTLSSQGVSAEDTLASFSSRGPALGGLNTNVTRLKPDIAAPGLNITSSLTGVTGLPGSTGEFTPNNRPLTISGTSMAAPHIAGIMGVLRQLRPDYTVEEMKAVAMNGSINDVFQFAERNGRRYGAGRVGAGRTSPVTSASNETIAYNADGSGTVSVSYDGEVITSADRFQNIRVDNKSTSAVTYTLGIDTVVDAPGVTFSVANTTLTIPANSSRTVRVRMQATANSMDFTRDLTVLASQTPTAPFTTLPAQPRQFLTEETSFLTFTSDQQTRLRLPLYVAPRPASTMRAAGPIDTKSNNSANSAITLTGTDVCTGTRGTGTCTGTFPQDRVSLVSPFELQVVSPRNAQVVAENDLQHVGVAYNAQNGLVLFGVSMHGDWGTPNDVGVNISIDANSDGTFERVLFQTSPGNLSRAYFGQSVTAQDVFLNGILTLPSSVSLTTRPVNLFSANVIDTAIFRNNVMVLSATPAQLGLPAGQTKFRYRVETCPGFAPLCGSLNGFRSDIAAGPFTYDFANQGVNFGGAFLLDDLNGAQIPLTFNLTNMRANGSLGALLLHHFNASGSRSEPVQLVRATDPPFTLTPIADAYVQGAEPDTNFGAAPDLQVKRAFNPGSGKGRQAYLRFDTSAITGDITRATLRVYGALNVLTQFNSNIPCAAFGVSTPFDEATITWNNKPAPDSPNELSRVVVTNATPRYYEFDVTAYVRQERAAGRLVTGMLLRNMVNGAAGDFYTVFNSKEAANNPPQLFVTQ